MTFVLNTRYEEHTENGGLPFTFSPGIFRTARTCSQEANWHEDPELELCLEGEGYVLLEGEKMSFRPGDAVVVNSGLIHYTGTAGSLRYACLIIDVGFCRQNGIDPARVSFETHFRDDALALLLRELAALYEDESHVCRIAKLRATVLQILIALCEKHAAEKTRAAAGNPSAAAVKSAVRYIVANYSRPLSLEEIAGAVYMDKFNLSRQFKKQTRQTIVQYIHLYRCKKVKELLAEGESVADAARLCGFCNLSFFAKIFRRYMGVLPSAYKREQ